MSTYYIMDFNFQYPSVPGCFCNYNKQNQINHHILKRNEQLHCTFQNQLDPRPSLSKCCHYIDDRKNMFPSSCDFTELERQGNIGHMKCYANNIDHESSLLHAERAKGVLRPDPGVIQCRQECGDLTQTTDPCFPTQHGLLWNNPTKRKHLNP